MIETHISTGTDLSLQLKEAILLYRGSGGAGGKTYLEARRIVEGPNGPEYGAGRPVDAGFLARVLREAPVRVLSVVHRRLLASGDGEAVWWSPAGPRTPFFSRTGPLGEHSLQTVAMPALVFHAQKRRLRVRALACRGMPGARAPLYHAPLWNVYTTGWLCMGSMPIPPGQPVDCIEAWEAAFWDTAFTTPHHTHLSRHPFGYAAMLTDLRTLPRFPARWLVPAHERLESWLNR
ncbi:MAG TPA: PRTRC system protein B [Longimicrobiaceae bacterium]|jgi:PRTRC genetic system protein B|nr:PRTRC system protein B [Longimicrobiaceae bacterium]